MKFAHKSGIVWKIYLIPDQWGEAPCEGTNYARLFTPGERNALAKSKVHQISWSHGSPFMGGHPHNIGAFCLRMREIRSVRLQMADFKEFVSFVMVFMKNMD